MLVDDALSEEVIEEFIACARYGELEELRTIMSSYPDTHFELKNDLGNTALHMASANGHLGKYNHLMFHRIRAIFKLIQMHLNRGRRIYNTSIRIISRTSCKHTK